MGMHMNTHKSLHAYTYTLSICNKANVCVSVLNDKCYPCHSNNFAYTHVFFLPAFSSFKIPKKE